MGWVQRRLRLRCSKAQLVTICSLGCNPFDMRCVYKCINLDSSITVIVIADSSGADEGHATY
jgi:hypothetical protein